MLIEMKVSGLTLDPITGMPIVILKDLQEKKAIPIWIGIFEASAIATELEKIRFSRPMTHDLLKEMLQAMEVKISRIEIQDLRNNTFFACIFMEGKDGETRTVDARPSDAIALALRMDSPIFIEEKVIEKSRSIDFEVNLMEKDKLTDEKLKEFLENLPLEDFGKYKM
ncbi:MAG: bifunctional nuclease family protein [Deltaproteobacteria bacterium]|nr:bifunctional nuclease family protein [Deltaproteobacteria bacterium]